MKKRGLRTMRKSDRAGSELSEVQERQTMSVIGTWRASDLVFLVFVVICTAASPQAAASGDRTVRGMLQQVVGIGGETTGLAILLDAPIKIDQDSLNQLEIEGDKVTLDKLVNKYVKASGTIVYHNGVERGRWPVLKVSDLEEVRPDGKAEFNLGQRTISLSLDPAEIVWKNVAGQSSGVQPKLTFTVTNNSKSDLVFNLRPDAHVCFSTQDAETRTNVWKYPEGSLSNVIAPVTVGPGKTLSASVVLPEKAAPNPGTYILKGTVCGYEEYQLTTQFVVGTS